MSSINGKFFPVKPVEGVATTHLVVDMAHIKPSKGAVLSATPMKLTKTEAGYWVGTFSVFSGKHKRLETMPKLDRKRLAILLDQAEVEIKARSGPAWDLAAEVLKNNKLELAEPLAA